MTNVGRNARSPRSNRRAANERKKAQGIDSTPTILINGTKIAEWHDFNAVKQAIEAELAKT